MVRDFKAVTVGNPLLKGLEGLVLEFEDLSAIHANQVIMMASFGSGFISGFPVGKFSLGSQTKAGEEFQGPVNGRMADLRIGFDDLGEDLSKTLMSGGVEEDVENLFPLFRRLQPFFGDSCFKEDGFYRLSPF